MVHYLVTLLPFTDLLLAQSVGALAIAPPPLKFKDKSFELLHLWWKFRPPPFNKLTEQQQDYLLRIFRTGSRHTEVHNYDANQGWFEELGKKELHGMCRSRILPFRLYILRCDFKRLEKNRTICK